MRPFRSWRMNHQFWRGQSCERALSTIEQGHFEMYCQLSQAWCFSAEGWLKFQTFPEDKGLMQSGISEFLRSWLVQTSYDEPPKSAQSADGTKLVRPITADLVSWVMGSLLIYCLLFVFNCMSTLPDERKRVVLGGDNVWEETSNDIQWDILEISRGDNRGCICKE